MNKLQIGIDIGGTNIKAGIVDEEKQILANRSIPFPVGKDYKNVVEVLKNLIYDMNRELKLSAGEIKSIGVAVPGSIDPEGERVIAAHNIGFYNVPLKMELQRKFPLTNVLLSNDANAAALAELHAGALKGCKTGILLTLGTGLGGGIILNGRMFNGGNGNGIELGHMVMQHRGGDLCTCGNTGCAETVCSAAWLAKQGKKLFGNDCDAKYVIDRAKAGEESAVKIFTQYVEQLGMAVVSLASILDPEIIALGGGVSQAGEFLYTPLKKVVEERSYYKHSYKIVPAKLGNYAGIIGAALLAGNDPVM